MVTDEQIDDYLKGQPDLPPTPEPIEPLEEIPQYRFKTEQEFIEEFGDYWFGRVFWHKSEMDYLFGEMLEPDIAETFYKHPSAEIRIDEWFISINMITDKPLK